ncbi:complement C1r subcomponent-like protein isoform X2 [Canis lupus familiaris]|uniref:complement C1r subcomponent-like protein isoform X2 n=1 Tax=Canis lupus familiaris TaxID=9615 RepID=UPI0003ADED66|nr:complement C1r subcomponent-like protein isoform X2 [Canis lupus familiaris]XP_025327757.1 complement C1r subcomponent-like protein isoform X2 [Canis lupus dingo]|eukprot:XP_005637262.1 complement C1r subcomponent-like protein isoform X2 [Canis lupus familiaris]
MSSSRCLVSQLGNDLWRSPQSTGCPGKMWWLLLWGVFQACPTQGSVLLAQQLPQQLTSPGYPEPYRKGQESSTDIEAPDGFAVRLVFQDFDLEPSQDCEQDSVTITASGMDPSRFCGQQGSSLGSPPGQREFVSPGNRLRLTFRAPASSRDRTTGLHKGFLALYQAVEVSTPMDVNHSRRPISQASGASKAISTRGDPDPLKIQNHCCREPYYQAVPAGTLNCTRQNPWKETQDRKELPHCVPVCGRPVAPIAQSQEAAGSSRAKLGNFPWQAFTSIYGRGGGALLGDRWILTAAHTIHPKDGVLLGKNRSVHVFLGHTSIDEMLRRGSHPVRRVVVHPDYRQHESRNFDGDLALLELQRRVPLGPSLLPVCLPEREALYRSGVWGYVSGFGVDLGWLTTELKYSRLPVAPRAACQAWLQDKQRSEVFSANMFCAGDKMRQQSVCQGDSGGVYVVWDERAHHWVATGIVSWGIGCGKGYGFYTKVLNYLDWIKGVMDGKD